MWKYVRLARLCPVAFPSPSPKHTTANQKLFGPQTKKWKFYGQKGERATKKKEIKRAEGGDAILDNIKWRLWWAKFHHLQFAFDPPLSPRHSRCVCVFEFSSKFNINHFWFEFFRPPSPPIYFFIFPFVANCFHKWFLPPKLNAPAMHIIRLEVFN